MLGWVNYFRDLFDPYGDAASAIALLIVIGGGVFGFIRLLPRLFGHRPAPQEVMVVNPLAEQPYKMEVAEFIRIRSAMRDDILRELAVADPSEAVLLRRRVEELERQIADPDPALAEALAQVESLKARLEREGNSIGAEKLAAAEAALDRLDFSIADALFAEIEERQKLEVQTAARAAFARGEIAEAEARWSDAAAHYSRAASLHPTLESLFRATHFTQLAGHYPRAQRLAQEYLDMARAGGSPAELSRALDRYAAVLQLVGQFPAAEAMFSEALKIVRETFGPVNENHAAVLNNLAGVVWPQGRYGEAERLYAQAIEIDRETIGETHTNFAIHLNNLAGVVEAQGRYGEAEGLYRQAIEICQKTIGEDHPDFATLLNNLAGSVQAQGRYGEAEGLSGQALKITSKTVGQSHPSYAIRLANLGQLLGEMGRKEEAREMLQQCSDIFRAALPADHPHIAEASRRLKALDTP